MKYGKIADSESMNAAIYRCFEHLSEADAKAYVTKFAQRSPDQDHVKHTFRELILGAFLASNGLIVESDRLLDGKTLDWSILENGDPKCILELVSFQTDKATKDAIQAQLVSGRFAFVSQPDHTERLFETLQNECTTNRDFVNNHDLPYVSGLFLDFDASVNPEQLDACLFDKQKGLFAAHPYVSGVLVFIEIILTYRFMYFANPNAMRPYTLPGGEIDRGFFRPGKP